MKVSMRKSGFHPLPGAGLLLYAVTLLGGCGGGDVGGMADSGLPSVNSLATGTTTLQLDAVSVPDDVAAQVAQPSFHLAPATLDEPADSDRDYSDTSARQHPHSQQIPAEFAGMSTRRLTPQSLHARHTRFLDQGLSAADTVAPMASSGVVATYTPAQIRAAYSLPALPVAGTTLTAAQAAQLGAGQTIYIVDAMHDPNVAAELAAFNTKFGLPACTTTTIATTASLPLAGASGSNCQFSVVYNTVSGAMTGTAPAYDSGWATEIALDVQWAHATAPLARIILIEAASASVSNLTGAVQLANSMGAGVVSMSFGAVEGNWTASVDSYFAHANMTYLAATGDAGAAVEWPAVSSNVVAVSGTTLTYSGTTRSEVVWSGTGGGISLYTATPGYQNSGVPGMGTVAHRSVADVAFNADPSTGQYLAVITPGSTTASWYSVGGTSLSTPQWAGIIAVANAQRAIVAKAALGEVHAALYGQIASVAGNYAAGFADISKGSDGTCITCSAKVGYDQPTGLGTPNVTSLLSTLSGVAVAATAPVVTPASISGTVGTALSFTVSVANANPVTYSLTGAPSGMTISSAGIVNWTTPVVGSYAVTVTAYDAKTGLSGKGLYSITIAAQQPPTVGSANVSGQPGVALTYTVAVSSVNPVTYALVGAPSGMSISTSGVISWPIPILGSYAVTVIVKDTKTGLSSQGIYTFKIAVAGPVITSSAMTGVVGKPVSGTISLADAGATSLSVTISGAPLGMTFSVSGMNVIAYWANPVLGSYSLKVSVTDSAKLSAQATVPISITAK